MLTAMATPFDESGAIDEAVRAVLEQMGGEAATGAHIDASPLVERGRHRRQQALDRLHRRQGTPSTGPVIEKQLLEADREAVG